MSDDLPDITLGYADDGSTVVFVDLTPAATVDDLVSLAPALCQPANAMLCAQAVNHLAQDRTFTVISDPQDFAAWFRKRHAEESPDDSWKEGGFQLRNFAMPDLEAISPPTIEGERLQFFAVNRQIGAPYRVTAPLDALGQPDYAPMQAAGDATR